MLGAIGVVQLSGDVDVAAATAAAVACGVWLRPFRDLIYTMPAYLMDEEDVATVCAAMQAAAAAGTAAGSVAGTVAGSVAGSAVTDRGAQAAVPAGTRLT